MKHIYYILLVFTAINAQKPVESVQKPPENFMAVMADNNKEFDENFAENDASWLLAKKLYAAMIEKFSYNNTIPRIPLTFHLIWLGSALPERYVKLQEQLKQLHPGFTIKIWTDEQAKTYPMVNRVAYNNAKNFGKKSDIWRYEILYNEGGIYIDGDFQLLKPLTPLACNCDFFTGMSQAKNFSLANGLIGTIPHHTIMKLCIEKLHKKTIPTSNVKQDEQNAMTETGPYFFTDCFLEGALKDALINVALPPSFFYPWPHYDLWEKNQQVIQQKIKPYSYAVHEWACSWQSWSPNYVPYHEDL